MQAFNKMIAGFKNLKDDIKGYGKLILLDNLEDEDGRLSFEGMQDSDDVNIQISLTTNKMIEYDNEWVKHQGDDLPDFLKGYRPYFFEFYATTTVKKLKKLQACIGEWKDIVFSEAKEGNENGIEGEVIFCASPLKRKQGYIIFSDPSKKFSNDDIGILENKVETMIDSNVKGKLQSVRMDLMKTINGFDNLEVTVYNVGQGNFIELCFYANNDVITVLFDIGMTPFINPKRNRFIKENIEHFKDLEPNAIILSHWDTDHILGIANMKRDLAFDKDVLWIVPDPTQISKKVSRSAYILLSVLLKSRAKIAVIRANSQIAQQSICATEDKTVTLWKGLGKTSNDSGLILQIIKNGKALLFPGDCKYTRMPAKCICSYDFMVASHHGAKQSIPKRLFTPRLGRCIVSFGSNPFGHPTRQYLIDIRNKGYVYMGFTDYVQKFSFSLRCWRGRGNLVE